MRFEDEITHKADARKLDTTERAMDEYLRNREEELQNGLVPTRQQMTLTRSLYCWTKRTTMSDVMSVITTVDVFHDSSIMGTSRR